MQALLGETLKSAAGDVPIEGVLNTPVVGLYFSAHWCPPCRHFTPILAEFYKAVNAEEKKLEIIFVSSDKEEGTFQQYVDTMPWLTIPYGDSRIGNVKQHFKVSGIPLFILINKDASLAHGTARGDVTNEGPTCFDRWLSLVN
jgi:nucleoredoxin